MTERPCLASVSERQAGRHHVWLPGADRGTGDVPAVQRRLAGGKCGDTAPGGDGESGCPVSGVLMEGVGPGTISYSHQVVSWEVDDQLVGFSQ